jgi:hypothetical protein
VKEIADRQNPAQGVTQSETRAEAIMDGEKTGLIFRTGAMLLDKLYLHSPLTDLDSHLSIAQHVTPGRVFLGTIATFSARNAYKRFRNTLDPVEEFEREEELEEFREIEEATRESAAEHI